MDTRGRAWTLEKAQFFCYASSTVQPRFGPVFPRFFDSGLGRSAALRRPQPWTAWSAITVSTIGHLGNVCPPGIDLIGAGSPRGATSAITRARGAALGWPVAGARARRGTYR